MANPLLLTGPTGSTMLRDVARGLAQPQKELAPKYFYDERGSRLFERITELPEYYPTRTERAILHARMPALMHALRPATLVELGAGSAAKTRLILDAMHAAGSGSHYVPLDVSASFLADSATRLRVEYPWLRVMPVAADFTDRIPLPAGLPRPLLMAFLGSTIGNFSKSEAVRLLRRARGALTAGDRLLLGADLRKNVARLEAAYDDADGVTAEFNRNMLRVLNRELGADFDPDAFDHEARYNTAEHRIEMHLVARMPLTVQIPGAGTFRFDRGESVRTEISCKYDRPALNAMFALAGFHIEAWLTDPAHDFALVVAAPLPGDA
ncbi:MAG: L-histidine N(alpha)-methyltransferase [Gemmatimonadaceae bacterium]